MRKNLLAQFLPSSVFPRPLSDQGHYEFVLLPTHLLQSHRLLLLLHLPLPGRPGHANRRCLRLLLHLKHAGAELSLMLPPLHEFLRFHLPPQFFHLLPLLMLRHPASLLRALNESGAKRPCPLTPRQPPGTLSSPTSTTIVRFVRV